MKKIVSAVLVFVMMLSLAGCGISSHRCWEVYIERTGFW